MWRAFKVDVAVHFVNVSRDVDVVSLDEKRFQSIMVRERELKITGCHSYGVCIHCHWLLCLLLFKGWHGIINVRDDRSTFSQHTFAPSRSAVKCVVVAFTGSSLQHSNHQVTAPVQIVYHQKSWWSSPMNMPHYWQCDISDNHLPEVFGHWCGPSRLEGGPCQCHPDLQERWTLQPG